MRAGWTSVLLVVALPDIASAAPASTLTMHEVDGTNVHLAGGRGAMHWDEDIAVTVELRAGGVVAASANGRRKDHQLYVDANRGSYNTDDVTTWKTTWAGTFKQTTDTLVLALAVPTDSCARTKTADGAPPETLACRPAAKRTTVTCATTHVALADPATGAKPRTIEAWSCAPTRDGDLGESPAWRFGKTACIELVGGHMTPISYRACRP